ncbi:helix-turn-helix domain-containing protein [Vineibacter terrae]|uniref:Helix-turn-helix domain-containing protein n=1 Tax=Vineibacter terrae TaxID=2586908 RepID=A0A5C8P9S7_9HYPH|nr:helix-turn-helix domain-containing protein [Vineibacter terrae]TXL70555.1 helix-turn-helix domain-containing protein [Vineibacter terrae]
MDAQPGTSDGALSQLWFNDSDEFAALLGYADARLTRLSKGSSKTRLVLGKICDLEFRTTKTTGFHHLEGSLDAGIVHMHMDLGSGGSRRLGGRAVEISDLVVGAGGAQFDFLTAEQYDGVDFRLPETLVAAALDLREPISAELFRGTTLHVVTNCDRWITRVRGLTEALIASCTQPAGSRAHEHAHAGISDALVAMLLLPWKRSDTVAFRSLYYQRLPIVRRVTEFMHANLGEPLMTHDLCRAGRASERAVEYAFRDVCGIGPKQYLKMLRLNRVRRDLKALPADVASVTQIAHQYGFWHMGHFSKDYRQLFGETPRQTRNRRT